MNTALTTTPEATEKLAAIGAQVKTIVEKANAITVTNQDDVAKATVFLGDLKSEMKAIEKARKDLVDPLNDTVKKINNQFRMRTDPLEQIEEILKGKIKRFVDEEERKAQEEAVRLRAEQELRERAAREEAVRATKEADEKRIAAESAAKVAALSQASDREAKEAESAWLAAEAERTRLAAVTRAEELSSLEQTTVAVAAPPSQVRTESGLMSVRKVWKFEVVDISLLPAAYLIPDEKKIAQSVRDGYREIPGVRIYQDSQIAVR